MDCKFEVIEAKFDAHKESFERHVNDYRTLRATFTNVTVALVALIFGVSAAYVGGVYSLSNSQGSLVEQQAQLSDQQDKFSDQQSALARQQNDTYEEMKAITTELVKINHSMSIILKEHKNLKN